MVFTSQYCAQLVFSTIPIPELPLIDRTGKGIFFCLQDAREQPAEPVWTHRWTTPNGKIVLAHRQQGEFHWLRFPALADFSISQDARDIVCYPLPQIPTETIRHLLLDQVLPRCLAHQGKLMLHASAVWLDQGVLLFIGGSGAGKSTLAGNFHQAGQPALADDCVWLKENYAQPKAVPSYGGLRLWKDSLKFLLDTKQHTFSMAHYSTKKRVFFKDHNKTGNEEGFPIIAIIVIPPVGEEPISDVTLELLSQREAYMEMVKQTFLLDVNDLDKITYHFQSLGRMMPFLRSYRLSMPRNYNLLPIVRKSILEKVTNKAV